MIKANADMLPHRFTAPRTGWTARRGEALLETEGRRTRRPRGGGDEMQGGGQDRSRGRQKMTESNESCEEEEGEGGSVKPERER